MTSPSGREHFALGYVTEATFQTEASLRGTVDISREDFDRYSEACSNVERIARTPFIRKHVSQNYSALEATFDHISILLSSGRRLGTPDRQGLLETLAGQVVNWLTAMRLYLDHTEAQLGRRYGKESAEFEEFKAATAAAFDQSSAYRFTYKLRNYVQHLGLPFSHLTMVAAEPGERATVSFVLVRDDLLRDYDGWGAAVRRDLQERPPEFPLRPLIQEMMDKLSSLHLLVMAMEIRTAASTVGALEEAAARLPVETGTPMLFRFRDMDEEGDRVDVSSRPLQIPSIEALRPVADGTVDPSSMIRPVEPVDVAIDAEVLRAQLHPNSRGVEAISAWLGEEPSGTNFIATINQIIQEDGDPSDLITGLINVSGVLLHMTARSIGAEPKGLLQGLYTHYVEGSQSQSAEQPGGAPE